MKVFMSAEIEKLEKVKNLAVKPVEQVVLVFSDHTNKIQILDGESSAKEWAVIPPLNSVITWIRKKTTPVDTCIIIHNHPEIPWYDVIVPSKQDIACTELLKWQFALIGIELTDHIIIAGNKQFSLLNSGLYDMGPLKVNGFEIKRFLYCFLLQLKVVFAEDFFLTEIINILEKNLDRIRSYYEQPYYSKIFKQPPRDSWFKKELRWFEKLDFLPKRLIQLLMELEDGKNIKIDPYKIIPYGIELQNRIIAISPNHA